MTTVFKEIFLNAALTEDERITQISAALSALLPGGTTALEERKLLEPYVAFKRPYLARLDDLKKDAKTLSESSLVVRVEPLAADAAKCGPDDDVSAASPLRSKSADIRHRLGEEKKLLADMADQNTQLTAIFNTIAAAEEKVPQLTYGFLDESRDALRFLGNNRDAAFRANIQDSVGTILDNIDKQLDAVAGHQQKKLEKKLFHKFLDAGLTTGSQPLSAPAIARFRRKPQVQP